MMPTKMSNAVRKTVVIGLFLAGCASAESPSPTPTPTPVATPTPEATPTAGVPAAPVAVTVHKTGGFAGVEETITIDAQGNWRKAGFSVTRPSGTLTAVQLAELQSLAADPRIAEEARAVRSPSQCSDTFHYRVTIGDRTVAFDECPSDPAPPRATMALLAFITDTLP